MSDPIPVSKIYQENKDPSQHISVPGSRIRSLITKPKAVKIKNCITYSLLSALSIVANAMVPVLSVFLKTAEGDSWIKFTITLLSSCAVIATSLLVLFNSRELWTQYRTSASTLTSLLHQYYTHTGIFEDVEGDAAFRLLARLTENQLEAENDHWSESLGRMEDHSKAH